MSRPNVLILQYRTIFRIAKLVMIMGSLLMIMFDGTINLGFFRDPFLYLGV